MQSKQALCICTLASEKASAAGVVIVAAVLRGALVSLSDRDGWHREEKTGCCCQTFWHVSDARNTESAELRMRLKKWSVSGCDANFEFSFKAESYRRADIPLQPELGRRQRAMTDAEVDFCPECGRWLVCMIKDKTFIPELRSDRCSIFPPSAGITSFGEVSLARTHMPSATVMQTAQREEDWSANVE